MRRALTGRPAGAVGGDAATRMWQALACLRLSCRPRAAAVALGWMPMLAVALAPEAVIADLAPRVRTEGVERTNMRLLANASLMTTLNQGAADCIPEAVDLAVTLSRTQFTKARDLHHESLRIAVGTCTQLVLSRLTSAEVPKVCTSVSTWTVPEMARELRRRIHQIEIDERRQPTPLGKACHDAYVFEFHNTRVGLRVAPPRRPR